MELGESVGVGIADPQSAEQPTCEHRHPIVVWLCRLAESLIDLIAHEKVAEAVRAGRFADVLLTPAA